MIETIKKLVESPVYEDNRLALILIAQNHTKEALKRLLGVNGSTNLFGICLDSRPNGIYVEDYCLFYCSKGLVNLYEDKYYLYAIESENFIRWNLKEEEDK